MSIAETITGKSNERAIVTVVLSETPMVTVHRPGQTSHEPGTFVTHHRVNLLENEALANGRRRVVVQDCTGDAHHYMVDSQGVVVHPRQTF